MLYTVRLNRKRIIYRYVEAGMLWVEEVLEPVSFTGLPYSTALSYKKLVPDAVIEQEFSERERVTRIPASVAKKLPTKKFSVPVKKGGISLPSADIFSTVINELNKNED